MTDLKCFGIKNKTKKQTKGRAIGEVLCCGKGNVSLSCELQPSQQGADRKQQRPRDVLVAVNGSGPFWLTACRVGRRGARKKLLWAQLSRVPV